MLEHEGLYSRRWGRRSAVLLKLTRSCVISSTFLLIAAIQIPAAWANTYVVTTTASGGPQSLRAAITAANLHAGSDVISFNIPGPGVHTIALSDLLPIVTDRVRIDGTTQPGFEGVPLIELRSAVKIGSGLVVTAGSSVVRSLKITGFRSSGVVLRGPHGSNTLEGNDIEFNVSIGDPTGLTGGINIEDSPSNRIGGPTSAARNIVSGNGSREFLGTGVVVIGSRAQGNDIVGNYIGPDPSGTISVSGQGIGVNVIDAPFNRIGGPEAADRNVISGNQGPGIHLSGLRARGNLVEGNFIGLDKAGARLSNSMGVLVDKHAGGNTIGTEDLGNKIASNASEGIVVTGGATDENTIEGNEIFGNGFGIDLGGDGVTANDIGDVDSGPNLLQNFPVLTSATTSADGTTTIKGILRSSPAGVFLVEFFANRVCDPSGYGQGETFLSGTPFILTNGSGNAEFEQTVARPVPIGQFVTATAVGEGLFPRNTSEFSACRPVTRGTADLAITKTDTPDPVFLGGSITYTVTVANAGPDKATNVSVTDSLPPMVSLVSATPSQGSCGGIDPITCDLGTLFAGTSAVVTIVVTPMASGLVIDQATVSAADSDPNLENNTAMQSTTVVLPSSGSSNVSADFDGDGFQDLAIGVPGERVGSIENAGAVNVLYGSKAGITAEKNQLWSQDSPGVQDTSESGDRFAAALAAGDFNHDGMADLAIGVPGEGFGQPLIENAGAVNVLYGTSDGLMTGDNQFWSEDTPGVPGVVSTGDAFGASLDEGDFNADGQADLAIGIPGKDTPTAGDAGAALILPGSGSGLTSAGGEFWQQGNDGILDSAEPDDVFGASLSAADFNGDGFGDLAIGAPGEAVVSVTGAGAINVIYGSTSGLQASGNQFWNQDSPGIADLIESDDGFGSALAGGDYNGDGSADLAIGVPGENIGPDGGIPNAGATNVLYGSVPDGLQPANNQFWFQGQDEVVLDAPEPGDGFGSALSAADFNADGSADLAIGVPGEDLGTTQVDAGAANVLYGSGGGLIDAGNQFWHQGSGVPGTAATGDRFGSAAIGADFNADGAADLGIGVPGEDVLGVIDAGAINIVDGSPLGLVVDGAQYWNQDSPGILDSAEPHDGFGLALG
jgi:uncharacterized repeat protein (TIGR01451 family)